MSELVQGTADGGTPYWIELAFDWDASPHPTLGHHLLQIGLAVHPEGENGHSAAPASFGNGPKVGDSVGFILFDNSAGAAGNPSLRTLQNVEVWLTPTRSDQAHTSPFGLTTGLALRPRSAAGPPRSSASFGETLPAWPLFDTKTPNSGPPAAFQLAQPGRFFLSARVEIESGGELRSYRVDPEMIVSNTGGGGGGYLADDVASAKRPRSAA